ncbi:hypothetical protein OUZ56_031066 [Daphnia magna]|uniref:Uncharacterized protein n=1 Tax=Daphnia magna TaxID=35525 RepID=A0ABQ9ZT61_9CRUS|nr:hypothetical protein OUZ56_031066 [Daphnia magna]
MPKITAEERAHVTFIVRTEDVKRKVKLYRRFDESSAVVLICRGRATTFASRSALMAKEIMTSHCDLKDYCTMAKDVCEMEERNPIEFGSLQL